MRLGLVSMVVLFTLSAPTQPRAGGPAAVPLSAGTVKLQSRHPVKKILSGGKKRTHFRVKALEELKLRAMGPLKLVIQVHGSDSEKSTLIVTTDGRAMGESHLGPEGAQALHLQVPAGHHTLTIMPLGPDLIRVVQVKRGPKAGEKSLPWQAPAAKTAAPASVAEGVPTARPAERPELRTAVDPDGVRMPSGPQTLFVLDLSAVGLPPESTATLHGQMAAWLARVPGLTVLTKDDVTDQIKFQQDRQLLGCEDDQACVSALAEGLNTDLILSGSLGTVGKSTVLILSLLDARKAAPLGRVSETVTDLSELPQILPGLLANLIGREAGAGPRFALPADKTTSFAVLDLAPTGVSADVARNLTEMLSVELKRIENASVVSRDDLSAMLQLEEQKTLLACTQASCIAEIGGALGVDKLVVGQVGKLAESYVVTLRLIDPRQAAVENRVTETFRGQEDQLIRAVRQAGRRLVGVGEGASGSLAVNANAPDAELSVDQHDRGALPQPTLNDLPAGRHVVRVSRDGYHSWQSEVYVDPGETTAVFVQLQEAPYFWYEQWWVWTVAGVVVAGAVTSAVLLSRDKGTPDPYGALSPGDGQVIIQNW